uniref:Uncharacterized protein n=1 Tax=Cucumis melo TaxID=3656 RepID=A0A9I9DC54_CUCME
MDSPSSKVVPPASGRYIKSIPRHHSYKCLHRLGEIENLTLPIVSPHTSVVPHVTMGSPTRRSVSLLLSSLTPPPHSTSSVHATTTVVDTSNSPHNTGFMIPDVRGEFSIPTDVPFHRSPSLVCFSKIPGMPVEENVESSTISPFEVLAAATDLSSSTIVHLAPIEQHQQPRSGEAVGALLSLKCFVVL